MQYIMIHGGDMREITIPYDVADGIVLTVLQDQLDFLKNELVEHKKGAWMHPEDVYESEYEMIPALETLIRYFGG